MGVWVFIRHGESVANAEDWLAGHLDVDLTARGVEQARALGEALDAYRPDRVFSSDLLRARRTAEVALHGRALPVTTTSSLRERTIGAWDGLPRAALKARGDFPVLLSWDGRPPGGESQADLARRALTWLAAHDAPGLHLAFAHAGLIRVVTGLLDGLPTHEVGLTRVANAEIVERDVAAGTFTRLVPRGSGGTP